MARRNNRVVASDDDVYEDDDDSVSPPPPTRSRRAVQVIASDEEAEEEEEEAAVDEDAEDAEEDEEVEEEPAAQDEDGNSDNDNENLNSSTPSRLSIVIKRRGRGRGRGRGSRGGARGTVTRGRPRGRPRGRGRGALPHGMLVVQKGGMAAKLGGDDDDDPDGTYGQASVSTKQGPSLPVGTTYREIEGKYYIFENDELQTEEDEVGNTKIDANGNLLGGRVFKADTFCSPWRPNPEKRYMLSIDAARTSGFRDSLYYFRRNLRVAKLPISQAEKDHLISLGRLSNNLRSRTVTIVAARSAFKLHGAKMVKDGRWVTDDYYEEQSKQECTEKGNTPGELVGELPDLNIYPVGDVNQPLRTLEERRQAAAGNVAGSAAAANQLTLGAGGIYRPGGPTTHFGGQGLGPFDEAHAVGGGLGVSSGQASARRAALQRDGATEDNWMWKIALHVHEANDGFTSMRKSRLRPIGLGDPLEGGVDEPLRVARDEDDVGEDAVAKRAKWLSEDNPLGTYEPHTDLVHYRADTQPSQAVTEHLMGGRLVTGEKVTGGEAWALMTVDTYVQTPGEAPGSQ